MKGWVRKFPSFMTETYLKMPQKTSIFLDKKIVHKEGWVGGKDKNPQWKFHLHIFKIFLNLPLTEPAQREEVDVCLVI